jgi:hypothetical protein
MRNVIYYDDLNWPYPKLVKANNDISEKTAIIGDIQNEIFPCRCNCRGYDLYANDC